MMNKNFLSKLYGIFKNGCMIFTFVVFAFYILAYSMTSVAQALNLTNLFLVFLFSIWFAFSNLFLGNKKINVILRTILHFLSTLLGFFVIFILLPGYLDTNKSGSFVLMIGFTAFYALITLAVAIIKNITNKKKNEQEDYESIYDKSKEK